MKRRPDGRWQKRITLPNGKSKVIYSTAATERLANKEFNDYLLNFEEEQEKSELFEVVAEQYKEKNFSKLQNNTLLQYRPCYNEAVEYFSGMQVKEIKPFHIQEYVDYLASKDYAQKTIKNRLLLVSLILGHAVLYNKIDHNPCSELKIVKVTKKKKREKASDEDEQKIRNYKEGLFGVLAYFLLVTGCRRGEALALTPDDVTPTHIRINKTAETVTGGAQIKDFPKTEAGIRNIPITPSVYELLKPYMKNKYIFQNDEGGIITNGSFTRHWEKLQKEIGITCTPHNLRHSYATILFDAGIDVKTAQNWLGHKDINTTLAIYTHLSDTALKKNTEKLTDYLAENF